MFNEKIGFLFVITHQAFSRLFLPSHTLLPPHTHPQPTGSRKRKVTLSMFRVRANSNWSHYSLGTKLLSDKYSFSWVSPPPCSSLRWCLYEEALFRAGGRWAIRSHRDSGYMQSLMRTGRSGPVPGQAGCPLTYSYVRPLVSKGLCTTASVS